MSFQISTGIIKSISASLKSSFFILIFIFLLSTNISIFFDVPVLKHVLVIIFLTFIPGFLLLNIFKLDKLGRTEKTVLSVGLSVSFLILIGLLINFIYPLFGASKPLTTYSLLISFSVIILILAIIAYLRNPNLSFAGLTKLELNTRGKFLLLLPAFFPLLSILGIHIMNITSNNIMVMVLLFIIPAYTIFIAVAHNHVPDNTYPVIVFFISISLLLLYAMRSNHLLGVDTHEEYYYFQLVFQGGYWRPYTEGALDGCLSISLLPTIYESLLQINPEYLFKLLYPLLVSILPLAVFVTSRKYVGSLYAFLASLFLMTQYTFLLTTSNARTNLAILFFFLVVMVVFHNGIKDLEKRILFIIFATSCIMSHYSTTYIFFFVLLLTWLGMLIVSRMTGRRKKPRTILSKFISENRSPGLAERDWLAGSNNDTPGINRGMKKYMTVSIVAAFFILFFLWYGQISSGVFSVTVGFVQDTLVKLNQWFLLESRGGSVAAALGAGILEKGIAQKITFVFSWMSIALIVIGILGTMLKYKRMVLTPNANDDKMDLLHTKIDIEFLVLSISCTALLVFSIAMPHIMEAYALDRVYFQVVTVLSSFFVIGGLMITRFFRASKAYLIIILALVPYLMCQTGLMYQVLDSPREITLNSAGPDYNILYIHDQESSCAIWLKENVVAGKFVYSDLYGERRLLSQGLLDRNYLRSLVESVTNGWPINGYIFLRYTGVVDKELFDANESHDLAEYQNEFIRRPLIYANGGSEVWK